MPGRPQFDVTELEASFGATVTGLGLTELDEAASSALYDLWLEHGLLIFPRQHLSDAEQMRFARRFGELEIELVQIGNIDENGKVRPPDDEKVVALDSNRYWHADSTFKPVQAKGAVFSARIVPEAGGETAWADMGAAYDALDAATKHRIASLSAVHVLKYYQVGMDGPEVKPEHFGAQYMNLPAPPLRPLVKVHCETGRRCLNIGRHATQIPGMDPEAARRLLDELRAFACQPPRVWTHRWTAGDVVIWDNRRLLHRVLTWDYSQARDMRHTRLAGDPAADFAPGFTG